MNIGMIPGTGKSVASLIDITELKEAERKVRESVEKYRAVVGTAPFGIIILDRTGKIIEVNEKILELSGLKRKDLVGKRFIKILPKIKLSFKGIKWSLEDIVSGFRDLIKGVTIKSGIITLTNIKGEQVSIIPYGALLKKNGKIIGYSLILEDVTKQCKTEEKIRESFREKEALLREIHHRVKNNLQIITSLLNLHH